MYNITTMTKQELTQAINGNRIRNFQGFKTYLNGKALCTLDEEQLGELLELLVGEENIIIE